MWGTPNLDCGRMWATRQKTRDGFPTPILVLKGLFDSLDVELSNSGCDDTLRFTREYIQRNAMDEKLVVAWLENNGDAATARL